MPVMQWSQSLSVGIPEMDNQHKKLIDLINQLYEAMGRGKGTEALAGVLDQLETYTKYHFAAEEKFMLQMGYPVLDKHKLVHKDLAAQVVDLKQKLLTGKMVAAVSVGTFLKDWLQNHIQNVDMKYGQYAHSQMAASK